MATLRERSHSKPAYTLVDLDSIEDDELREDIILDASEGGGLYGVRVVEEAINGPARSPIYGVYNDGPDADRWASAKEQLGLVGEEVDDAEVRGGPEADDAKAANIRKNAEAASASLAEAITDAENAEVEAIAGKTDDTAKTNKAPK